VAAYSPGSQRAGAPPRQRERGMVPPSKRRREVVFAMRDGEYNSAVKLNLESRVPGTFAAQHPGSPPDRSPDTDVDSGIVQFTHRIRV
jgi:hypothetical protein